MLGVVALWLVQCLAAEMTVSLLEFPQLDEGWLAWQRLVEDAHQVDAERIWMMLPQVGALTLQEVVVEVDGLTFYSEVLHVAQCEYPNNHGICTCLRALTRRNQLKIEG